QETNGRWSAGPLDMRRIADLFELRRLLEPVALRQSTLLRDRALLTRMRERVCAAQAMQSTTHPIPLRRIEHDLHGQIVLACANLDLRETLHRSQLPLFSTYLTAIDFADMPDVRNMLAAHLAVFDALLDGDPDGAAS